MMIVFKATMFMLILIAFSCMYFQWEQKEVVKKRKDGRMKMQEYWKNEISQINELEVLGVNRDDNSDYPVADAIHKIKLPENARIKLND